MKKTCVFALGILLPGMAFAQGAGSLNFTLNAPQSTAGVNKLPAVRAPVYIGMVDTGLRIDPSYTVAIYGGVEGTPGADLTGDLGFGMTLAHTLAGVNDYETGGGIVGSGNGYNSSPKIVTIPGLTPGTVADVQVRSWKTSMGSSWGAAYEAWIDNPNNPDFILGVSDVLTLTLGDSTRGVSAQPRLGAAPESSYAAFSATPGIASFALVESPVVPEPGTLALAGLGLLGMWVIRRRQ